MALFEYKCRQCSALKEKISKEPMHDLKCEVCGGDMVKQFSTPAFRFTNGQGTGLGSLMSIAGNPPKSY